MATVTDKLLDQPEFTDEEMQKAREDAARLTAGMTPQQLASFTLGLRDLMDVLGYQTPTLTETVPDVLALHPGYVFSQHELRFAYKIAHRDLNEVVASIPAENVPAEISGAWYELRSTQPLADQVREFLTDPDDTGADGGSSIDASASILGV